MSQFEQIIKKHIHKTNKINDRRIMIEAFELLTDEPILTNNEIDILKEIFMFLKEDYTLSITQDKQTLGFILEISKQEIPIIENKHNVNVLCNELYKSSDCVSMSKLEDAILVFLYACEHIEENEILIIHEIISLLEKNWTLAPIEEKIENENKVKYSKLIPTYQKKLIKKNKETN